MLPPVILGNMSAGREAAKAAALQHLSLTHESRKLAEYAKQYAELIYTVAKGDAPLKEAVAEVARNQLRVNLQELQMYDDVRVVHSTFGSACYIDDSFPSMLFLAYRYSGKRKLPSKALQYAAG